MSKRKAAEKRDPEDVEMASHEEEEDDSGSDGEVTFLTSLNVHTPVFFFSGLSNTSARKTIEQGSRWKYQLSF